VAENPYEAPSSDAPKMKQGAPVVWSVLSLLSIAAAPFVLGFVAWLIASPYFLARNRNLWHALESVNIFYFLFLFEGIAFGMALLATIGRHSKSAWCLMIFSFIFAVASCVVFAPSEMESYRRAMANQPCVPVPDITFNMGMTLAAAAYTASQG
jgi:hypothetical protein